MSGRLWSSQMKYVAQSVPFTYGRNKYKKSICWNVPCAQGHGPTNTDSDTKRAGNIKFNYKKSDERINILPHELESGNHSQKLSEHMMDQNHQRQILIQHLMYHLTYPATERGKYTMLEQESMEAICLLQYSDEECHFTILLSTVPIEMKSSFFPPPQKQVWFPSHIQPPNYVSATNNTFIST